jgi:hypothetical protein
MQNLRPSKLAVTAEIYTEALSAAAREALRFGCRARFLTGRVIRHRCRRRTHVEAATQGSGTVSGDLLPKMKGASQCSWGAPTDSVQA